MSLNTEIVNWVTCNLADRFELDRPNGRPLDFLRDLFFYVDELDSSPSFCILTFSGAGSMSFELSDPDLINQVYDWTIKIYDQLRAEGYYLDFK